MRTSRLATIVAALVFSASQAAAQGGVPINLQIGLPQGEFKENVSAAVGFGVAGIFPIATEFGIRAGFDLQIYGNETRRVPLGGGALGLINVDVTTTNSIVGGNIGAQIGLPSDRVKPYVGGLIGFSSFNTVSQVEGSNSDNQPFASSTNLSDNAFSKHVIAGMYFPLRNGTALIDLGARYTWNGESVRYLTPGDVSEDAGGNVILSPNETRADLLTITLGVTLRFGGPKPR
jgi:hypothetical protein